MSTPDHTQRQQALNPAHSFIIQAPAGSGKTELLIQRYLKLLSLVERPENILAITFTRKAASEMRHRILAALETAKNTDRPSLPHEQQTWELARAVLARDQQLHWQLLENSQRLALQTIDSFCAYLTQKLPILSRLGGQASVSEHPFELYQAAIRSMLETLSKEQQHPDFSRLMLHLDNNWLKLESLLAVLLAKRDHWLRFFGYIADPDGLKNHLESSLVQAHLDAYSKLNRLLEQYQLKDKLLEMVVFAAQNLADDHPIHSWKNTYHFPAPIIEERKRWQSLWRLCLTDKGEWRQQVNKNQGFPTDGEDTAEKKLFKEMKQCMKALLNELAAHPDVLAALQEIAELPAASYNQAQWEIILSLFNLLELGLEYLYDTFKTQNQIDFTEIALRSLMALGEEEDPTDLALHLDYQIQHILIDEFQDTSVIQMMLLKKLTAVWQPGDNKTLFLVGDPMQSIYRFRNAEVSLFLQTRQMQKLNEVTLIPLTLSSNFRCGRVVLDWINTQFIEIFSKVEDLNIGAVCYSPASAIRDYPNSAIEIKIDLNNSQAETDYIIAKIDTIQTNFPGDKIAILVQTRSQLLHLIPALRAAQISFQGVELTTLEKQPHIRDLFVLTRALLYLYDRVAWLAILRAPWCGLSLSDLFLIAENEEKETIWQRLNNPEVLATLSVDAKERIKHLTACLTTSLKIKGHKPLVAWVKSTWIDLGGPLCLADSDELNDCEIFFRLLRKLSNQYAVLDFNLLERKLNTLFAEQPNADTRLQIMTIHKAKGLEFDHVILPGLEKAPLNAENQLLLWSERQNSLKKTDLLLAPLKSHYDEHDAIYNYLTKLEKQRLAQEKRRLFYVAVTRAKKSLCLTAVQKKENNIKKGSFLSYLLHITEDSLPSESENTLEDAIEPENNLLYRLPIATLSNLKSNQLYLAGHNKIADYNFQPNFARKFGTIFHIILFQLIETIQHEFSAETFHQASITWLKQLITLKQSGWKLLLQQAYLPQNEIDNALLKITQGLNNIFQDPKGRWIISPKKQYQNEFALSNLKKGKLSNYIIDRLFVDDDDTLWIIDYKTSHPGSELLELFLEREKSSYQSQLTHYADLIETHYGKKPCFGLYFPFIPTWITYS